MCIADRSLCPVGLGAVYSTSTTANFGNGASRGLTRKGMRHDEMRPGKQSHCVFPSEKVGISGNDEIPEVFDTEPTKPIPSWKTA